MLAQISFEQASLSLQAALLLQVLWAMALGALVGWERERYDKPAGLRTHMLVAAAGALIAGISSELVLEAGFGDPTRGIHAIVTGIGFLGAGAILRPRKGPVGGLTTAATVFFTACLGVAVASGFGLAATVATVAAVLVLQYAGRMLPVHPPRLPDPEHDL